MNQSTDLLLTANFNHLPTYASPSPSNSDNQNAVTLLVSPTRATRPAQLIHNLFTTSFIPLETKQYYNFVQHDVLR